MSAASRDLQLRSGQASRTSALAMQSLPNRFDRFGIIPIAAPKKPSRPRVPQPSHPSPRAAPTSPLPLAQPVRRRSSLDQSRPERPLSAQKYNVLPDIAQQKEQNIHREQHPTSHEKQAQKQLASKQEQLLYLAIRTPDGARRQCSYSSDTQLGVLCRDVRSGERADSAKLSLSSEPLEVVSPADRVTFGEADMTKTLQQLGITDRSLLVLQRTAFD
ncbi:hypothetical protein BOX15_Mlig024752g1 [Macrostomum lignano]|uniref:UBX domain-containing protein n=1 Tax=Macrostomum lignano TaxID=282301 RepID=A0A267E044_9PLAT|nr:hypothetical protein BOX15_Mlig024752g1 [Macrostomum lignano]